MSPTAARRGRATGLVLVGILGAAVGLAVALPWAVDTGVGVASVGAALAALSGLAMLVAGAVDLVRSFRGWRRVPAVLGVVVLTVVGLYVIGIPVAATHVPPDPDQGWAAPGGGPARELSFPTPDGVTLSGTYLPTRTGAAVVVVPGAGSTRSAARDQALALWESGLGVLVIDPRGHGASDGRAMDLGWYGDLDVRGAVDALVDQEGVDPDRIGAVGLSMGGEQVLGAAPADERIRAVVAEGATARGVDDKGWLADEYGLAGRLQVALDHVMYGVTDLLTGTGPPTPLADAARDMAPRPALLIAAGTVEDEVLAAEHIRSAAPGNVTVWVVDGSGHTGGYRADGDEWTRRVGGFLEQALR